MAKSKTSKNKFGGFWLRTGAFAIDTGILCAVGLAIQFVIANYIFPGTLDSMNDSNPNELTARITTFLLQLSTDLGYFWILQTAMMGTLGKYALGLRVVNESMKRASYSQMLVRWFMRFPSFMAFGAGFLLAARHEKKQGWHDQVAKTVVVRKSAIKGKASAKSFKAAA